MAVNENSKDLLSFVMALCLGLLAIVQFRMMRNRDN